LVNLNLIDSHGWKFWARYEWRGATSALNYWCWIRLRCLVLGHRDAFVNMAGEPYLRSYTRCARCARRVY
jgi:hypothetical protein